MPNNNQNQNKKIKRVTHKAVLKNTGFSKYGRKKRRYTSKWDPYKDNVEDFSNDFEDDSDQDVQDDGVDQTVIDVSDAERESNQEANRLIRRQERKQRKEEEKQRIEEDIEKYGEENGFDTGNIHIDRKINFDKYESLYTDYFNVTKPTNLSSYVDMMQDYCLTLGYSLPSEGIYTDTHEFFTKSAYFSSRNYLSTSIFTKNIYNNNDVSYKEAKDLTDDMLYNTRPFFKRMPKDFKYGVYFPAYHLSPSIRTIMEENDKSVAKYTKSLDELTNGKRTQRTDLLIENYRNELNELSETEYDSYLASIRDGYVGESIDLTAKYSVSVSLLRKGGGQLDTPYELELFITSMIFERKTIFTKAVTKDTNALYKFHNIVKTKYNRQTPLFNPNKFSDYDIEAIGRDNSSIVSVYPFAYNSSIVNTVTLPDERTLNNAGSYKLSTVGANNVEFIQEEVETMYKVLKGFTPIKSMLYGAKLYKSKFYYRLEVPYVDKSFVSKTIEYYFKSPYYRTLVESLESKRIDINYVLTNDITSSFFLKDMADIDALYELFYNSRKKNATKYPLNVFGLEQYNHKVEFEHFLLDKDIEYFYTNEEDIPSDREHYSNIINFYFNVYDYSNYMYYKNEIKDTLASAEYITKASPTYIDKLINSIREQSNVYEIQPPSATEDGVSADDEERLITGVEKMLTCINQYNSVVFVNELDDFLDYGLSGNTGGLSDPTKSKKQELIDELVDKRRSSRKTIELGSFQRSMYLGSFYGIYGTEDYNKITLPSEGITMSRYARGVHPYNLFSLKDNTIVDLPEFAEMSKGYPNMTCLQRSFIDSLSIKENKKYSQVMKSSIIPNEIYIRSTGGLMTKSNKPDALVNIFRPILRYIKNVVYNNEYDIVVMKYNIISLRPSKISQYNLNTFDKFFKLYSQGHNNLSALIINNSNDVINVPANELKHMTNELTKVCEQEQLGIMTARTRVVSFNNHVFPYPNYVSKDERKRFMFYLYNDMCNDLISNNNEQWNNLGDAINIASSIPNFVPTTKDTIEKFMCTKDCIPTTVLNLHKTIFYTTYNTPLKRHELKNKMKKYLTCDFSNGSGECRVSYQDFINYIIDLEPIVAKLTKYSHIPFVETIISKFEDIKQSRFISKYSDFNEKRRMSIKTVCRKLPIEFNEYLIIIRRLIDDIENCKKRLADSVKFDGYDYTVNGVKAKDALKQRNIYGLPDPKHCVDKDDDEDNKKEKLDISTLKEPKYAFRKMEPVQLHKFLRDNDVAEREIKKNNDDIMRPLTELDLEDTVADPIQWVSQPLQNDKDLYYSEVVHITIGYDIECWVDRNDNCVHVPYLLCAKTEKLPGYKKQVVTRSKKATFDYDGKEFFSKIRVIGREMVSHIRSIYNPHARFVVQIAAHNGAKYDHPICKRAIFSTFKDAHKINVNHLSKNDMITMSFWYNKTGHSPSIEYKFIDTYKVVNCSLKDFGKKFGGVEIDKEPFNHDYMSQEVAENMENYKGGLDVAYKFFEKRNANRYQSMNKESVDEQYNAYLEILKEDPKKNKYVRFLNETGLKFHLAEYSIYYCLRDCDVLVTGYKNLLKSQEKAYGINISPINTQASLAMKTMACINVDPKMSIQYECDPEIKDTKCHEYKKLGLDFKKKYEAKHKEKEELEEDKNWKEGLTPGQIRAEEYKYNRDMEKRQKKAEERTKPSSLCKLHVIEQIKGYALNAISQSVTGGQNYLSDIRARQGVSEETYKELKERIKNNTLTDDFLAEKVLDHSISVMDAASLYPSAMILIDGLPAGKPKIYHYNDNDEHNKFVDNEVLQLKKGLTNGYSGINETSPSKELAHKSPMINKDDNKYAKGRYFAYVTIKRVPKKRLVPMLYKRTKAGIDWTNEIENQKYMVGDVLLRTWVNKHNIDPFEDIEVHRIISFPQKDYSIGYAINKQFKIRQKIKLKMEDIKAKKGDKDPEYIELDREQLAIKNIMNSFYGRLSLKIRDTRYVLVNLKKFKDMHLCKKIEYMLDNEFAFISLHSNKANASGYHHIGACILDGSKAIMANLHDSIEEYKDKVDEETKVYYTDTDSFYLSTKALMWILTKGSYQHLFKENNKCALPGQVDCDFGGTSVFDTKTELGQLMKRIGPISVRSYFVGKKLKHNIVLTRDNGIINLRHESTSKGVNVRFMEEDFYEQTCRGNEVMVTVKKVLRDGLSVKEEYPEKCVLRNPNIKKTKKTKKQK